MRQPEIAAASSVAATATTGGNQPLELPGWRAAPFDLRDSSGRADAERSARETDAGRQLQRCFPRWSRAFEHLRRTALRRLADNQPVDPNDADSWHSRDEHAQAVLRRHGLAQVHARRLQTSAIRALIDGQAHADRQAGLDWTTVTAPASRLDDALRRAHARLPIDLDDPRVWASRDDQRRALGRRLGVGDQQADDLSRWVLEQPEAFDPDDLRCWRIASADLAGARRRAARAGRSRRPAGRACSSCPRRRARLAADARALARRDPADRRARRRASTATCAPASCPLDATARCWNACSLQTLHAGPRECLDSARQLAAELSRELGTTVNPGAPRDKRDRWGRLLVHRRSHKGPDGYRRSELELRVVTFPAREFSRRRLGAAPRDEHYAQPSAVMDLGEAVQTAVERGLPLLLSTEAAGHLKDTVRVGRMKGRPGMLTVTSADGLSATTRRVVGRAGDRRTARAQAPAREGDARRRRPPGRAHGPRPAARRRPGAARPPEGDGGAEGRRLRRRRQPGRHRQDHHHAAARSPTAPPPRAGSARSWSPRAACSASGATSSRTAHPAAACRRWRPTSTVRVLDEHRSIAAQVRALRPRARRPPRRRARAPTACSTATRPTCRRSPGTC